MEYKVGDKVRVRSKEAIERVKLPFGEIDKYSGKIMTITKVVDGANIHYRCKEDNGQYLWREDDFEGYAFEYGEKIEVGNVPGNWQKRIYIGYIDGIYCPYIAVYGDHEKLFREGKEFNIFFWRYARPLRKQQTENNIVEINILINGKKINEPLSIEMAKRLGIVK